MTPLPDVVKRALEWAGLTLPPGAADQLVTFASWLDTEAVTAGGIGPSEAPRIWSRHIADSIVFGRPWGVEQPESLADLGSGVGLPGIPLAILFPDSRVTLIDRSGRRCALLRRALRILDLDVRVLELDLDGRSTVEPHAAVVSRAAFPIERTVEITRSMLAAGGIGVVALQRGGDTPPSVPSAPRDLDLRIVEVPSGILDARAWLLRMQRRE